MRRAKLSGWSLHHSCFNSRTLGRVRRAVHLYHRRPEVSFNSRTLGRVRQFRAVVPHLGSSVSIHAPWEGCDWSVDSRPSKRTEFQFTHPGKGATKESKRVELIVAVSIHAPWEGCDCRLRVLARSSFEFQFTHPGKGATQALMAFHLYYKVVSIHAPWEGCD